MSEPVRIFDEEEPEPHVEALLVMSKRGEDYYPKRCAHNLRVILGHDSRWAGVFRLNEFSLALEFHGSPVDHCDGEVDDHFPTAIKHWVYRVYGIECSEDSIMREVMLLARDRTYHPVRDYLAGLEWDGVPRVHLLLEHYFAAELPSDDVQGLYEVLGRCWLVSCVARVMPREHEDPERRGGPGCKVDTALILSGNQGAQKSTACRILARGFFADSPLNFNAPKDLFENLQGVWIYELAELDAFRGAAWKRIKALTSSPSDRWRRPYGKASLSRPRQVVFFGTTNEEQFLGDVTGARRWWPCKVGAVRVAELERDVDQLWAEAVHLYLAGAQWWLTPAEEAVHAEHVQEFATEDAWEPLLADWLATQTGGFTLADALTGALDKPKGQFTLHDEHRVGDILRKFGYSKERRQARGVRVWKWYRR